MKLLLRDIDGKVEEFEITANMDFSLLAGQQFFVTGAQSYDIKTINDGADIILSVTSTSGDTYTISLDNMANLIGENNLEDSLFEQTSLFVSTSKEDTEQIEQIVNNSEFNSGEIIDTLNNLMNTNMDANTDGTIIYDFVSLANSLEASASKGSEDKANIYSFIDDENNEYSLSTRNDKEIDTDLVESSESNNETVNDTTAIRNTDVAQVDVNEAQTENNTDDTANEATASTNNLVESSESNNETIETVTINTIDDA
ncbi:MAG: hypothetical protein U9N59_01500, partial [Campylobacterota bacterium]|nr:hypothetical protein [Campylobacterota bacterium]